jgi:hypothetical protein
MKLVREYINEKFTEDSDPIKDLEIGLIEQVRKFIKNNIGHLEYLNNKEYKTVKNKFSYIPIKELRKNLHKLNIGLPLTINQLIGRIFYIHSDPFLVLSFHGKEYYRGFSESWFKVKNLRTQEITDTVINIEKRNEIIYKLPTPEDIIKYKLSIIKEYINEKFTEDSDPIHDMDIGIFIKRDFNSEEDFHVFLANNITHILKVNKLPKVFILATDSYSSCSMRSKYSDIINKYIDRYVTINGEKKSDFRLFSISKLAKKLKEGVRKSTKEEVENSNNLLTEKFVEDSDPVHDMGIGIAETIKLAIKNIIKEDKKNEFIIGAGYGNIHYIHVTGAVGRGQQHRTGTYFNINFYSNTLYSPTEKYKNGNPKRIHRVSYASELVEKAGISVCFYDVASEYQAPYIIKFKIKPEYRKFFSPGTYFN